MTTHAFPSKQDFVLAADYVRSRSRIMPEVCLVLGSGLGALVESASIDSSLSYADIPGWPVSTVPGHESRLVLGALAGRPVALMCGRVHFYEGYDLAQVTFPIRVMQQLGVGMLIVTNAAGGVNPAYQPGELMLIADHLNLIGMAGLNPLRGPNDDTLGPRFPDMSQAYDRELRQRARAAAQKAGIPMQEGVYACLAGPSFETPAELRFLRTAGVDAVGMSTVPEVIVARHAGMRVLGISGISNKANLNGLTETSHAEVLAAESKITPRLAAVVCDVLNGGGGS